jgi:iron complex transport system substrate-binding protein
MSSATLRIVSLLPSATEIVCALGLEPWLVGVTHECDHPPSVAGKPRLTASRIGQTMTSAEIDHAVRSQLDGHGSIYELDEARLRALKPDLILTQQLCAVCAVSYKTVERAARRMRSPQVDIVSLEPSTIADIFTNIRTVGRLTGVEVRAEALVSELAARLDALALALAGVARCPRTLVLEWLEPPFAPGHWVPEQVACAGGDHRFGSMGGASRTTTAEELRSYAPEVIVLAPCGFSTQDTLRELPRARLPEGWHDLPAVREGNVWAVDATSYFSRPGPRVVEGAEILAHIIHPGRFGAPDERMATRVPLQLMNDG